MINLHRYDTAAEATALKNALEQTFTAENDPKFTTRRPFPDRKTWYIERTPPTEIYSPRSHEIEAFVQGWNANAAQAPHGDQK